MSLINWAVGFGTILATFPFSALYNKFGAKWPFFAAGLLSSVATAFIPMAAVYHLYALLGLRFLQVKYLNMYIYFIKVTGNNVFQGIAYAADFAAVGVLCSKWASLKQNGLFISVLTFYSPLSSFFTNSFGGMVCYYLISNIIYSDLCIFLWMANGFLFSFHRGTSHFQSVASVLQRSSSQKYSRFWDRIGEDSKGQISRSD